MIFMHGKIEKGSITGRRAETFHDYLCRGEMIFQQNHEFQQQRKAVYRWLDKFFSLLYSFHHALEAV